MMNLEIRHTMEENGRQKEMKNKQALNLATENQNKKQWTKLRETTVKIQERLRFVDFAMQSIPTGYAITQEAARIRNNELLIIEELQTAPYALIVALLGQIQFADDLQMVVRLLAGIVVSYGAINQMEKAERKVLLDYALEEVNRLESESYYTLFLIRELRRKIEYKKALLQYYVNRDRQVVQSIINGINTF
ncbi:hypothetical protein [Epilithonimonas hominis]|uniref:hypothetical protein n=2 Tax=Epilithonimonas TaxID=2782229 RepID=UPI002898512E|nr:hypothetical protein [Epilithonimonas hominis]